MDQIRKYDANARTPFQRLRIQVIREILSFLDYLDFVNFTMTCKEFAKISTDQFVRISSSSNLKTHTLNEVVSPMEKFVVNQYFLKKSAPAVFSTGEPEFQWIFYRENSKVLTIKDNVVLEFELVSWDTRPVRRNTWTTDFVITKAAALGDLIVVGHDLGLLFLTQTNNSILRYNPQQEIYYEEYHFSSSSSINALAIMSKGQNTLCILNRYEILVFNENFQVICYFRTRHEISTYNIPSPHGKIYILGHYSGGVQLYKTYQSRNQAVEILPNNMISCQIKKIRATRTGRIDLVIANSANGKLFILKKEYEELVMDFDVKDSYLFIKNGYQIKILDLSKYPKSLTTFKTIRIQRNLCIVPLNNKLLCVDEESNGYQCRLKLFDDQNTTIRTFNLNMHKVSAVIHFTDLLIIHGYSRPEHSAPEQKMTKLIYYYRFS